jgi:hypothetical protein
MEEAAQTEMKYQRTEMEYQRNNIERDIRLIRSPSSFVETDNPMKISVEEQEIEDDETKN